MLSRKPAVMALAAAFAMSCSLAMLQSARPALADQDDHHHRQAYQQRHDRDDNRRNWVNHGGYNSSGNYNNGRRWAGNGTGWNGNGWTGNGNRRRPDRDDRRFRRDRDQKQDHGHR